MMLGGIYFIKIVGNASSAKSFFPVNQSFIDFSALSFIRNSKIEIAFVGEMIDQKIEQIIKCAQTSSVCIRRNVLTVSHYRSFEHGDASQNSVILIDIKLFDVLRKTGVQSFYFSNTVDRVFSVGFV